MSQRLKSKLQKGLTAVYDPDMIDKSTQRTRLRPVSREEPEGEILTARRDLCTLQQTGGRRVADQLTTNTNITATREPIL